MIAVPIRPDPSTAGGNELDGRDVVIIEGYETWGGFVHRLVDVIYLRVAMLAYDFDVQTVVPSSSDIRRCQIKSC